jgi:hypothetical protein
MKNRLFKTCLTALALTVAGIAHSQQISSGIHSAADGGGAIGQSTILVASGSRDSGSRDSGPLMDKWDFHNLSHHPKYMHLWRVAQDKKKCWSTMGKRFKRASYWYWVCHSKYGLRPW